MHHEELLLSRTPMKYFIYFVCCILLPTDFTQLKLGIIVLATKCAMLQTWGPWRFFHQLWDRAQRYLGVSFSCFRSLTDAYHFCTWGRYFKEATVLGKSSTLVAVSFTCQFLLIEFLLIRDGHFFWNVIFLHDHRWTSDHTSQNLLLCICSCRRSSDGSRAIR